MRVARLYHEQGVKQADIARSLHLSSARVSRLLARAVEVGVVQTIVLPPEGAHLDLEEQLRERFGLDDVVIADPGTGDTIPTLGQAAARYLERTIHGERCITISAWSSTLVSVIEQLRPPPGCTVGTIAQLSGGYGTPRAQSSGHRILLRLATLTNADAVLVPSPGMLGSTEARDSLLADPAVRRALDVARNASVALLGIGAMSPSWLIRESGNAMPEGALDALRTAGAVGDICLRYVDKHGTQIRSEFDKRLVSLDLDDLVGIPRRIGVAGGMEKVEAIAGVLHGGWLTTLITDVEVGQALLRL
ncbi:MAG: sugar-binding domain-containing protein [Microbacterium sp.]